MLNRTLALYVTVLLTLTACGRYSGILPQETTTNQSSSLGNGAADTTPIPTGPGGPEFASIQSMVFAPKCSGCHSPQFASYQSLMAAKTAAGVSFIVPGSAQTSAVYIEISAGRMPKGGALSAEQIAAIRDWINAGAKQGATPAAPTPAPVAVLDATWTQLTAANGVLTNNCAGCHSGSRPSAGFNITNYVQAKSMATKIKDMINDSEESMPPSGLMNQAYRDTVTSWVNRGAPQ